jgi:hypothetical protein
MKFLVTTMIHLDCGATAPLPDFNFFHLAKGDREGKRMKSMMQFFLVIFVLLFSVGNPASAWGQPGKDAIRSLKKLEAKTQFGISYDDYSEELASTKSEVNLFLAGPDAKNQFKLAGAMKKALEHYDFAMLVWERAKKRKDMDSELSKKERSHKWWPIKKVTGKKESREEQQEEEKLKSAGKSLYYLDKTKDFDILLTISARYLNTSKITKEKTYVDDLLPIIWRRASNEVNIATTAFYHKPRVAQETVIEVEPPDEDLPAEESPARRPRRHRPTATKPRPAPPAPVKAPVIPGGRDKD